MNDKELVLNACKIKDKAYAPYSNFKVGAALLTGDGKLYTGFNIENSSFSASICAERVAFGNAISDGAKEFSKIAIVGGKGGRITDFCSPCGICRQTISEFCKDDFEILLFDGREIKSYTIEQLLPLAFGGKML